MVDLSDICTLVWPELREADGRLPPTSGSGAWILGWNPVGLSVIATALLSNVSFQEAQGKLLEAKGKLEKHKTPRGVPNYRSLQLLGYVRGSVAADSAVGSPGLPHVASTPLPAASPLVTNQRAPGMRGGDGPGGSSSWAEADGNTNASVRAMRKSDIWLELQEGPVLGEVWCCGYRVQPCQLHVIRCDPLRRLAVKPTVFSSISLYGPAGVRELKAGKMPITIRGAASNLEGVLLPEVMLKESAPRTSPAVATGRGAATAAHGSDALYHQRQSSGVYLETSGGGFMQASATFVPGSSITGRQSSRHQRRRATASLSNPGSASRRQQTTTTTPGDPGSSLYDSAGDDSEDTESERTNLSFLNATGAMESFGELSAYGDSLSQRPGSETTVNGLRAPALVARPGVPPRLDFPTSVDGAEMSTLLRMTAFGYNVQCVLQDRAPCCLLTDTDSSSGGAAALVGKLSRGSPSPTTSLEAQQQVRGGGGSGASPSAASCGDPPTNPYVHFVLNALIEGNLLLLKAVAPLRRVSWLMEVIDHRVREVVNLLAQLDNRTLSCGLHPALPHRVRCTADGRMVCYVNYLARVLTDVACGSIILLLLRTQGPRMYTAAMRMSRYFIYEMHMSYMDWFDGWPAGLKVNEDLNQALCFFAKVVIRFWDLCMRSLFFVDHRITVNASAILSKGGDGAESLAANRDRDAFGSTEYLWIVPSYDLLMPLSFLGASCSFALVADITSIVTFHLRLLYHAMSLPYRFARVLMSSLSNQFRGKKYNPLRKRTDVYEFTVDQMLMATFIFTIVVFLFPTLAVYYFYFALVRTSVWCMQESLVAMAHAMLYLPFLPVFLFTVFRDGLTQQFGGGVELSEPMVTMQRTHPSANSSVAGPTGPHSSPSTTVELTVRGRPFSAGCLFSDFVYVILVLAKPFAPGRVISLITSGHSAHPISPREDLIPHLVANCVDPPCTLCVPPGLPPALLSSATTAATMVIVTASSATHTPPR